VDSQQWLTTWFRVDECATTPHHKNLTCCKTYHKVLDLDKLFGMILTAERPESLKTVARELAKYRLDLVGIQEFWCDKGD
jgi:hypothetical protein